MRGQSFDEQVEFPIECGWSLVSIRHPPVARFSNLARGERRELDDRDRSVLCTERGEKLVGVNQLSTPRDRLAVPNDSELLVRNPDDVRWIPNDDLHACALLESTLVVENDPAIHDFAGPQFHAASLSRATHERNR